MPPPALMYDDRDFAYSEASGSSAAEGLGDCAASNSFVRYVRHQPQPVPAPKQSLNCAARRGRSIRKKFCNFRFVT